ncbi:MAG: 5-formyltetrahydrofolate cyclo-ligase [Gammaproteobacteria bacterium]
MRNSLRRKMRLRRRGLPPFRRQLANRALTRHLVALPAYRRARSLAIYWPADGEADVRGLAAHAWSCGKRLFLPVVGQDGAMCFVPWSRSGVLRRNRYGIPEPIGGRRRVTAARLDMLIMPLVVFDLHGNRLGMGGGYYDRAIGRSRRRPVLVGAAFSLQRVLDIPAQPWDIPLDMVVTERGPQACRNARRATSKFSSRGAEQ